MWEKLIEMETRQESELERAENLKKGLFYFNKLTDLIEEWKELDRNKSRLTEERSEEDLTEKWR